MISTVRFDLEEGPVIDSSFPPKNLNEEFVKKLAHPSFPDSASLPSEGQMFYTYIMKIKGSQLKHNVYSQHEMDQSLLNPSRSLSDDDTAAQVENKNDVSVQANQKMIEMYNQNKMNQYVKGNISFIVK